MITKHNPTTTPSGIAARRTRRRDAGTLGLCAVLAGLSGCFGGMSAIDDRVDRLLDARNQQLSDASRTPGVDRTPPEDRDRDGGRIPDTVDPSVEDLRVSPASESRDVAARLDAFAADAAGGDDTLELDLPGVFATANELSREMLNAEEEFILEAISLLIEQRRFEPRLFNTTNLNASRPSGVRTQQTLSLMNQLGVTRQLGSGGQLAASWLVSASDDLRESFAGGYSQSSQLMLSADIPLLRGAGERARESLVQGERNLVYAARTFERFRREFLVSLARDYFALVQQQAQIRNQERQLESLKRLEEATAARVDAGRLEDFQRAIAGNRVLQARASLASQRERYILSIDRLKIRLGLPVETPIRILPFEFDVAEPDVTLESSTAAALEYRLDLQTTRDRVVDARRGVANARNDLLPDLDVTGSVTLPTDSGDDYGGLAFDSSEAGYSAGLELSLPLDRMDERARIRRAQIGAERSQRSYEQARDNVVLDARQAVRDLDLARFTLDLAEQQVLINERRLEGQQLNIDEVDPQTIVDTENDLLDAQNSRDQARTDLRVAILDFLLTSGQLRVDPETGSLLPVPGLSITGARDGSGESPDGAPAGD